MRLFVTGATGFIGSNFINHALDCGHYVRALRRTPKSLPRISLNRQPEWLDGSFDEISGYHLSDIDVFVHLAAHSANVPYDNISACLKWNLMQPLSLLELARDAGISRFLITGTCFEYGRSADRYMFIPADAPLEPMHTYPLSKAAASLAFVQWAKEFGLCISLLRLFQVYGPGELQTRLWPSLCKAAVSGHDFPMTVGDQVRDFIAVESVASLLLDECVVLQAQSDGLVKISNLGTGVPLSIYDFCRSVWSSYNATGELLRGVCEYRSGELMRCVPDLRPIYV